MGWNTDVVAPLFRTPTDADATLFPTPPPPLPFRQRRTTAPRNHRRQTGKFQICPHEDDMHQIEDVRVKSIKKVFRGHIKSANNDF